MNISLTPALEKLVRQHVKSGHYNNASEVIRAALRLMKETEEVRRAKLKRLGHVTLTFRLTLVAQGGHRITVDAAGHY
jgi:antitoxin ParD1/3/4